MNRRRTRQEASDFSLQSLEARQLLAVQPGDDRFEPNDTAREVRLMPVGATNSPNLGPVAGNRVIRTLAGLDADVFRIQLVGTGTAADFARVAFARPGGSALNVQVLGGAGRAIRTGSVNGLVSTVSLDGLAPAVYFVRVFGVAGARNTTYRLTIQAPPLNPPPPPPSGSDDGYETNNTVEQVASRTPGAVGSPNLGPISGSWSLSNLKLNDVVDIFRFVVSAPGSTNRSVRITSSSPLSLALYNSAGTVIRSASAYLGQSSIDLTGLDASAYSIQVAHYALTPGAYSYGLTWTI